MNKYFDGCMFLERNELEKAREVFETFGDVHPLTMYHAGRSGNMSSVNFVLSLIKEKRLSHFPIYFEQGLRGSIECKWKEGIAFFQKKGAINYFECMVAACVADSVHLYEMFEEKYLETRKMGIIHEKCLAVSIKYQSKNCIEHFIKKDFKKDTTRILESLVISGDFGLYRRIFSVAPRLPSSLICILRRDEEYILKYSGDQYGTMYYPQGDKEGRYKIRGECTR